MAVNKVTLANMALSHIGAKNTLQALTEASAEAKQCNLWYEPSRRKTLMAYDWNFARRRLALAEHSEDPPEGVWAFRYQYPASCLVAREIENGNGGRYLNIQLPSQGANISNAIPFEIETDSTGEQRTILTDMEDAVLIFTFDQTSTDMFSDLFDDAQSWLLAHYIAFPLTGSLTIKKAALESYMGFVRYAMGQNANEQVSGPPREAEWVRGRN